MKKQAKKSSDTVRHDPALLIPEGTYKFLQRRVFSVRDMNNGMLNWEEYNQGTGYQRAKTDKAVEIGIVLDNGGVCPDPIWVSQRKDSSYWIVDGIQRYLGHFLASKPLAALVHEVAEPVAANEKMIFHVLNHRKALSASHTAMTWPNAAGALLNWANEASALEGHVNAKSTCSTSSKIAAASLAKALLAALTGKDALSGIGFTMTALDRAIKQDGTAARRHAEAYCQLIADAFIDGQVLPGTVLRGFGLVLYRKMNGNSVPLKLTRSQVKSLQSPGGKYKTWKDLVHRVGQEGQMVGQVIVPRIMERWTA